METETVISEPISAQHRAFAKKKSASMTILSAKNCGNIYGYSKCAFQNNETLESKMSNIEISLSSAQANASRRRKVGSVSGTLASRHSRTEAKELRSALQDRETAIQNLRIQLCLGKLPRPTGPPLDESEKPAAEQKLSRMKAEAENKRIVIRNLKCALDKLDITDNIDTRIRQAELEYALGREELQMLSIVEEVRALQARLEKSKPESHTLFSIISSGTAVSLHAVQATTGRWAVHSRTDSQGLFIEWALEGDGLYKGDLILEVNGKLNTCKTKEELQKLVGNSGKCQMVVLRKKSAIIPQKQLDQEKENNLRLQHRISYLEEQVKELQSIKERENNAIGHVTSISITSPPSTPPEKPLVFQRGNYITTLVGGKPIELLGDTTATSPTSNGNVTKTIIKESKSFDATTDRCPRIGYLPMKSQSASKISINGDSSSSHAYMQHNSYKRDKERCRDRAYGDRISSSAQKPSRTASSNEKAIYQRYALHARSVEHLNHYNGLEIRREPSRSTTEQHRKHIGHTSDVRSVKSLDFDSENESVKQISDSMSEARSIRPTPPKKPLRLSLQRAQSLQTVELNQNNEIDRKRSLKRTHYTGKATDSILIENCNPLQTSSLGRQKHQHNI